MSEEETQKRHHIVTHEERLALYSALGLDEDNDCDNKDNTTNELTNSDNSGYNMLLCQNRNVCYGCPNCKDQ
jgi:hypothetical protein